MDKSSFRFNASPYGSGEYIAEVDGLKKEISEKYFSDEKVAFAEKLIASYPTKVPALAKFCMESECFKACYPDETMDTIMEKLHLPDMRIDNIGGILTYYNHELDEEHIIEVEFSGLMNSFFSVGIDGWVSVC